MTNITNTLRDAVAAPFDFWLTAAESGPLMFKTLEFGTALHKFSDKYVAKSSLLGCAACIGSWADPSIKLFKAYTDGVEPLKDLYTNGCEWASKARKFSGDWYRNEDMLKLVSRVALVSGLLLGIPIYLANAGFFTMGSALTANVGLCAKLSLIDFARGTLITAGTAYNLYEKQFYKLDQRDTKLREAIIKQQAWEICDFIKQSESTDVRIKAKIVTLLERTDIKVEDGKVNEVFRRMNDKTEAEIALQKQIAEREVKAADLAARKEKLGYFDDSTKIVLYAANTIITPYISPISTLVGVAAVDLFNKWCGVSKNYYEAKKREHDGEVEKFRIRANLEPKQMTVENLLVASAE